MSHTTIVLSCPACKRTLRTGQETRPEARMRCPGCHGLFRFFVHGNGGVELRPVDDEREPATGSRLPPRLATQDQSPVRRRTIFTSRRRNRAIGGYMPFEKTRSYLATFAFWTALGLGSLAAYWYFNQIDTMSTATGRKAGTGNPMNADLAVKRKAHQEKVKRLVEKSQKTRSTQAQPAEAKVEVGRQPGDRTKREGMSLDPSRHSG